jgi:S1-C subfamily serine protease
VRIADDSVSQRWHLPGVLIVQVEPGGSAAAAGLRGTRRDARGRPILGDIIVAIDADKVTNTDDLMNALERHQVGDTVTVTVIRDEERLRLPVTLQPSH